MSELERLMEKYAMMVAELGPMIADMNAVKSCIQELIKERGESLTHAGVQATYRKGNGWLYTWNKAKLDTFADMYPELYTCRNRRQKKASAAIKYIG